MERVHSLCVIDGNDCKGFPMLYNKIIEYTSKNHAIIYAAEADINRTINRMGHYGMEVETLVESGALTIVDRNTLYSLREAQLEGGHAILDKWHSLILKAKRKSNFKGILAIGSSESFFEQPMGHRMLVKYEQIIGKKFAIPFEAICCYSAESIAKLSLGELVTILNAHHSTINCSSHRYQEWNPYNLIKLARDGIDRTLGKDLSELIFKTMKLCYRIDDYQIVSNPFLLEEMLTRIIGNKAAEITVTYIKDEVKKYAGSSS